MAAASVFLPCLGFWLLLSGHFDWLTVGLGVLSAALVTALNRDIEVVSLAVRVAPRYAVTYVPWLLKEIVLANLQVVSIVLHPRLPIDPVVIRFRAPLRSDAALTTLGNSITLTPGTVTLDVEGDEFVVHALTRRGAADVAGGAMARRIARTFGEIGGESVS